jgi:hypothetical protein
VISLVMTIQQRSKQEILRQIKALTNSGRHMEAMGLYQRHFGLASGDKR